MLEHVKHCEKHPMAKMQTELSRLRDALDFILKHPDTPPAIGDNAERIMCGEAPDWDPRTERT